MERPPPARGVLGRLLKHLRGVLRIIGFGRAAGVQGRRRVDKDGIPVIVKEHGRPNDPPGVLIHELEFIEDQQVRVITAQGIRVPTGLGPDLRTAAQHFDAVLKLVLVKASRINGPAKGLRNLIPEALDLLLRGHAIKNALAALKLPYRKNRDAGCLPSPPARPNDLALAWAVNKSDLARMRVTQAQELLDRRRIKDATHRLEEIFLGER